MAFGEVPDHQLDADGEAAIAIWNQMGGAIDWAGVPFLAAVHGVDDLDVLVAWLTQIRDQQRAGKNG